MGSLPHRGGKHAPLTHSTAFWFLSWYCSRAYEHVFAELTIWPHAHRQTVHVGQRWGRGDANQKRKRKRKRKMYCNMVWIKDGSGMNLQWRRVVLSGSPRTCVNRFWGGGGDSAGPISILWVRLSVLFSSYALVSGCTLPAVRFAIIKFCTRILHLAAIDSDLYPGPLKVTRRMWLVVEIRVGRMSSGNKAFMPLSVEGEKTGCSWEVNETLWLSLPCEKGEHTPNTEGQSSTWNISGKLRFGFQEADSEIWISVQEGFEGRYRESEGSRVG